MNRGAKIFDRSRPTISETKTTASVMIKKKNKWCCQSATNQFKQRNTYGEFLVAGRIADADEIWFFSGCNMAHRKNDDHVLDGIKKASKALDKIGISNFILSSCHCVHYCSHCGINFEKHYGTNGGLLRDDQYVSQLPEQTQGTRPLKKATK